MGDCRNPRLRNHHLNDINPDWNIRMSQQAQPRRGPSHNRLLLVRRNRIRRTSHPSRRARFNLYEDQRLFLSANNVDLPPIRWAKIPV